MNHSGALRRKSGITVHDFLSERKAEEHVEATEEEQGMDVMAAEGGQ